MSDIIYTMEMVHYQTLPRHDVFDVSREMFVLKGMLDPGLIHAAGVSGNTKGDVSSGSLVGVSVGGPKRSRYGKDLGRFGENGGPTGRHRHTS